MTNRPIVPTRIIPPGAPLPDRPPGPDDIPPWRAPARAHSHPAPHPSAHPPKNPHPNPHPAPADPGPIEVRVTLVPAEVPAPEPEPTRLDRIRAIAPLWKILAALAGAVVPIPGVGYSISGVWAYCVSETRDTFGAAWGYALALITLSLAGRAVSRTRSLRTLFALAVCLIGVTGAAHLYDPITALTGAHPR